jgi:hypothetical protein
MSMRDLLIRGMLAGLIAAVLGFGFARIVGEPEVNAAISFEDLQYQQSGEAPEHEIVTRDVQSTVGLATGLVMLSVAFGGMFAVAFAFAYGRLGTVGVRGTALFVSMLGFAALYLVPFLKYPANPPSVGDPDTIARRTALYFGLMLLSILATTAAVLLWRRLAPRYSAWNAVLLAGAAYLAVIVVVYLVTPSINEVPEAFPAVVLWKFRLASVGLQFVIWASLGLAFGALTERALERQRQQQPVLYASPSRG